MNINKFVLDLTMAIENNKIQSNDTVKVDTGFGYKEVKDVHCFEGEIIIRI